VLSDVRITSRILPNVRDEPRPAHYCNLSSPNSSLKKPQSDESRTDQAVGSGGLFGERTGKKTHKMKSTIFPWNTPAFFLPSTASLGHFQ
jgi:hypothetical protein